LSETSEPRRSKLLRWVKQGAIDAQFVVENKTGHPIKKGVIVPKNDAARQATQHEIDWQVKSGWIIEVTTDKTFKPKLISGVFCIPKSDGTARLVYDGRALNEYLVNEKFTLPEA